MHIPISSVIVQNPPDLLPTRSIWPLSICPGCRCHSQPLPGVSRKQRYNTLDFPRESRVPRKALPSFGNLPSRGTPFPSGGLPLPTGVLLAPIGNPEPKGLRPSRHPCFRRLCIYKSATTCIFRNLRKRKNPTDFTHTRMKSVGFLYCRQSTRATSIH